MQPRICLADFVLLFAATVCVANAAPSCGQAQDATTPPTESSTDKSTTDKSSGKKVPDDQSPGAGRSEFETLTLQGRVVWMSEALLRRHGIREVPEAAERALAIETRDGQLCPLVEDTRGRAFRADPRLRNIDVELLVRRYRHSPSVQIIRLFELAKDGKYELDYWCDICSIVMVELKECECCQARNELRRRKVKE